MLLKKCPKCGGAAEIRTEKNGRLYEVQAICTQCGRRGRQMYDREKPAPGAASIYWAKLSWNCGMYDEREGKV